MLRREYSYDSLSDPQNDFLKNSGQLVRLRCSGRRKTSTRDDASRGDVFLCHLKRRQDPSLHGTDEREERLMGEERITFRLSTDPFDPKTFRKGNNINGDKKPIDGGLIPSVADKGRSDRFLNRTTLLIGPRKVSPAGERRAKRTPPAVRPGPRPLFSPPPPSSQPEYVARFGCVDVVSPSFFFSSQILCRRLGVTQNQASVYSWLRDVLFLERLLDSGDVDSREYSDSLKTSALRKSLSSDFLKTSLLKILKASLLKPFLNFEDVDQVEEAAQL
ncbi:unnamed protein product [Caenorhabditis auriculariae]|uniref:Uncharacterized protein n=1 Tax=Caenorhabditis auriculariae TaxID=2777116 RepID=A0A8S1HDH8_9PELO|nr:unnamed protein product [Caenorhabditis auriculariae]